MKKTKEFFNNDIPMSYKNYKYDDLDNVVKTSDDILDFSEEFDYDIKNNLIERREFRGWLSNITMYDYNKEYESLIQNKIKEYESLLKISMIEYKNNFKSKD